MSTERDAAVDLHEHIRRAQAKAGEEGHDQGVVTMAEQMMGHAPARAIRDLARWATEIGGENPYAQPGKEGR